MPSVNQQALVPYSAAQMYQLVNDYEHYPEFLPGCVASQTLQRGDDFLIGELTISKAGIRQTFATYNQLIENQAIRIQLKEGPFQSLQGEWRFVEIDDHCCQIELKLEFEFANSLIAMAFGQIFNHLTQKMIDAFKQRAKEIYR